MNIYDKAADILVERGHSKGMLCNPRTGAVCLFGALNLADHGDTMYADLMEADRVCQLVGGHETLQRLVEWNNEPETTPEMVVAWLRDKAVQVGAPEKEIEIPEQTPWEEPLTIPTEWPAEAPAELPDPAHEPVKEPVKTPV